MSVPPSPGDDDVLFMATLVALVIIGLIALSGYAGFALGFIFGRGP